MKMNIRLNIRIIVQILSITFFCNVTFATESKTEFITKTAIKGNPKSVEQTYYKAVNLTKTLTEEDVEYAFFSKITKEGYIMENIRYGSRKNLLEKTTFSYNENHNLINVSSYDSAENILFQRIYIYNKKEQLIEREDISKDNSIYEREIYKYINNVTYIYFYDSDGKLKYYNTHEKDSIKKEDILYLSDGKPISKKQYEYDDNGKLVRYRSYYIPENNLQEDVIYKYDDIGNLLEIFLPLDFQIPNRRITYKYDDRGYLYEYAYSNYDADYKFTYSYNDHGNLTEELCYKNEILDNRTIYKYDLNDNWIEKTVYEEDNLMKVTKRKIEYYEM